MSGRKRTTHPLIFHNLLCEGPQTLIFVASPPPPEHPKVVIFIVTQISLLSLSVYLWCCSRGSRSIYKCVRGVEMLF